MREKISESDCNALLQSRMSDQQAVTHLYDRHRSEFVAFARKTFALGRNDAVELYQECFIALYENVQSGKLAELTCSLKTYLCRIARNKICNRWRNHKPHTPLTEQLSSEQDDAWSRQEQIAYELVQQMEEPCNTVLTLYYWERCSMEQIARKMNYAGAQVAKNRKLICMRKLRSALTARFSAEEII